MRNKKSKGGREGRSSCLLRQQTNKSPLDSLRHLTPKLSIVTIHDAIELVRDDLFGLVDWEGGVGAEAVAKLGEDHVFYLKG